MKRTFKRILTAVLGTATVFSFSSASLAVEPSNFAGCHIVSVHSGSVFDDDYEELEKLSSTYGTFDPSEEIPGGKDTIHKAPPSSVDLSTHPAFPPIQDRKSVV